MIAHQRFRRILVYGRPVDMRNGFNGLQGIVRRSLGEDPLSGDLFVFISRSGKIVKALFWDRTGFMIISKQMERGRFSLRHRGEKLVLTQQSLELLLDGIPAGGQELS